MLISLPVNMSQGKLEGLKFGKTYNLKELHCAETLVKELNIKVNIFQVYCMR